MTYLYAIGNGENKQKIGFSSNPLKRLATLQTGNPDNLMIHYTFEINEDTAYKYEHYIHNEYNHKRIKGEWFNISADEIKKLMLYHEITYESDQYKWI